MQTRMAGPARAPRRVPRTTPALAAGALGLVSVALSAVVPWLTVFRGLQRLPGFVLEGGPLVGVVVGAIGLVVAGATVGGSRWLKPAALLAVVAVAADAILLQLRITDYVTHPGPAGLLTQPTAGIGALLLALGAAAVGLAIVALPVRSRPIANGVTPRLVAAVAIFIAGWIHLLLVPEHFAGSPVLGLGFLTAGMAQLVLAGLVLWRPRDWTLVTVVAVNATLISIYAYAVLVGLPVGGAADHAEAAGLVIGSGEPIDAFGAASKIGELVSLVIAFGLLGRLSPAARRAIAAS